MVRIPRARFRLTWAEVVPAAAASTLAIASIVIDDQSASYAFAALSPVHIVLALTASLPLLFVRRWPLASYLVILVSTFILGLLHAQTGLLPAIVAFGLGWVAFRVEIWRAVVALLVTYLAFALLAAVAAPYFDSALAWLTPLAFTGFWGIGASAGAWNRTQARKLAESERSLTAAAETASRQRAEERRALARDLHDEVANSLAAIIVQIDVLQTGDNPMRAAQLRAVADEGRNALHELRRVMELLRTEPAANFSTAAPESLASGLARLSAADGRLGGRAVVTVEPPDLEVPPSQSSMILAIAGELLANARRHGNGLGAQLRVHSSEGVLSLTSTNATEPRVSESPSAGAKLGLVGIEERVVTMQGDLAIDDTGGQFIVHIRVPQPGGTT